MSDYNKKIDEICEIQSTILSCLKSEIGNGIYNANTDEVGAVADIIKDLSESVKCLRESAYYEKVVEAMEDPYNDRPGYTPRVSGNIRYGYKPMVDQEPYINKYLDDRRTYMGNEYGEPYNEYKTAKRHYTQTGSSSDRSMMDKHAREHLDQTIETIEDIWDDATPELQSRMKSELKRLLETMS